MGHDLKSDAASIREILQRGGGDDDGVTDVVNILTQRSVKERQQIKRHYRTDCKEELADAMVKAHKQADDVITALLNLPEDFDAKELQQSMKGVGTKEVLMSEIMCSRSNEEISAAAYAYRHWFGRSLKEDIEGETSGPYRELITTLLKAKRDEGNSTDMNRARQTAEALSDKKDDSETFTDTLCLANYGQLNLIAEEYAAISGKNFEDGVKKEFGGDAEDAAMTILKVARSKPGYFADIIHDSVKKDHVDVLLRVACSRTEKDLHQIRDAFVGNYNMPMDNFVDDYVKDKKHQLAKHVALELIRAA